MSSRPRERKARRPLPLYDVDRGRVKLCAGDRAVFFERKHAAEVRRILRRSLDRPWPPSRADVARLEELIDEILYDPAGMVR